MAKGRVLLVDTDPDLLASVATGLRTAGYAVLTARDAVHATRRAVQEHPDVVVTELSLPGGSGHAVAERLRECAATATVPVVYLAARAVAEDYERARRLGVAKFIDKPCELAVLVAAIDGLVELKAEAGRS